MPLPSNFHFSISGILVMLSSERVRKFHGRVIVSLLSFIQQTFTDYLWYQELIASGSHKCIRWWSANWLVHRARKQILSTDIYNILNVVTEICSGYLRSTVEGNPSQLGGSQKTLSGRVYLMCILCTSVFIALQL